MGKLFNRRLGHTVPPYALRTVCMTILGLAGSVHADTTFLTGEEVHFAGLVESVVTGDFNGDGISDLAAIEMRSGRLAVSLGQGDGTYAPSQTTGLQLNGYRDLSVGDFNGDGRSDIATSKLNEKAVCLLTSTEAGSFNEECQPVADWPRTVAMADVNADRLPDITVVGRNKAPVGVVLNKGDGHLGDASLTDTRAPVGEMLVDDVNNDGVADMVGVSQDSRGESRVHIRFGKGDGMFKRPLSKRIAMRAGRPRVADINNDGLKDLLIPDLDKDAVAVWLTKRDQRVSNADVAIVPGSVAGAELADMDGDGNADLVVSDDAQNQVQVFRGDGQGHFDEGSHGQGRSRVSQVLIKDLNGDGKPDVIVRRGRKVYVYINGGRPGPVVTPEPTTPARPEPTTPPTTVPAFRPTTAPTLAPTVRPTVAPTPRPTAVATVAPTLRPTAAPTVRPTTAPTAAPTVSPVPTARPVRVPTPVPSVAPTAVPTAVPTPRPTTVPPNTGGNDGNASSLENSVHNQINAYRQANNLLPLTLNGTISATARTHSANMAAGTTPFGHDGFSARASQLRQALQPGCRAVAENVAWNSGFADPATTAVQGWIASEGHHANIIGNYATTGIGVAINGRGAVYLTQIFCSK